MTREDIVKLAREQGLPETATEGVFIVNTDDLGRMLAAEREACAEICDFVIAHSVSGGGPVEAFNYATGVCAKAIRARGQQ